MADITIAGATYPDVPAVDLPISGGGTQRFVDTSDANATANDLAAGKSAYVNGTRLIGSKKANIRKITDYLFYFDIDFELDYAAAEQYVIDNTDTACSVVRNGNYVGRNFDNLYNNIAEFVVSTKALKGRHASIGVATMLTDITNAEADSGAWNDLYEILPFCIMDGINDKGVFVEMNTAYPNDGRVTDIDIGADMSVSTVMLGRYILDFANSAAHAIQLLGRINIIPPMTEHAQELRYMIADANSTYVVEFLSDGNGGVEMVAMQLPDEDDHIPAATNFYLHDYFDDGSVVGYGKDRYDYIVNHYDSCGTKQGMTELLQNLHITDYLNITLDQRDGTQSHTRHSSIYDFQNKALTIYPQPDVPNPTGEFYNFAVNGDVKADAVTCWEDLAEKPFYDVVEPGFNYEIDYNDSYVSGYIDSNGSQLPVKWYRVDKVIRPSNLVGAVASIYAIGSTETVTIARSDLKEIDDDGSVVGTFAVPNHNIPAALIVNGGNTTIDYQGQEFGFTCTFTEPGTYLPWVDMSIMGEGYTAYVISVVKQAVRNIKQLEEKFYKGTYWAHATFDLSTMQVTSITESYDDVYAAYADDKDVKIKVTIPHPVFGNLIMNGCMYGYSQYGGISFISDFYANLDGTERRYGLNINYNGNIINSTIEIVNTTALS